MSETPALPALTYVGSDGQHYRLDGATFDAESMPRRERELCRALIRHSDRRLIQADLGVPQPVGMPRMPEEDEQ